LQSLGRVDEADEIRRRIKAVEEVVKED
jgi:hypothetical protein